MAGEAEIEAIPHARELGGGIHLLRMHCHPCDKGKGLAEILEAEAAHQRLAAVLESPAVRSVHRDSPVLQALPAIMPRPMNCFQLHSKTAAWSRLARTSRARTRRT